MCDLLLHFFAPGSLFDFSLYFFFFSSPLLSTTQFVELHVFDKSKSSLAFGRVVAPLQMLAQPWRETWHKIVPMPLAAGVPSIFESDNLGEMLMYIALEHDKPKPESKVPVGSEADIDATSSDSTKPSDAAVPNIPKPRFQEDGFDLDVSATAF